jgi:hypothetical protein
MTTKIVGRLDSKASDSDQARVMFDQAEEYEQRVEALKSPNQQEAALQLLLKAAQLRRRMTGLFPGRLDRHFARGLLKVATQYGRMNQADLAAKFAAQSSEIYRLLLIESPELAVDFGMSLILLAANSPNKDKSLALSREAAVVLWPAYLRNQSDLKPLMTACTMAYVTLARSSGLLGSDPVMSDILRNFGLRAAEKK